jgi:hypothetical protein
MDPFESLKTFVCDDDTDHTPYAYPVSPVRGTVWINNGTEHQMVFEDEIPDGWVLGRIKVQTDKEQFRQQGLNNNNNAKKYRIVFRNGDVVECHQLSKWGRDNDIKYSLLKKVVWRTKHKKDIQFYCKSSPVAHIESICVVD